MSICMYKLNMNPQKLTLQNADAKCKIQFYSLALLVKYIFIFSSLSFIP